MRPCGASALFYCQPLPGSWRSCPHRCPEIGPMISQRKKPHQNLTLLNISIYTQVHSYSLLRICTHARTHTAKTHSHTTHPKQNPCLVPFRSKYHTQTHNMTNKRTEWNTNTQTNNHRNTPIPLKHSQQTDTLTHTEQHYLWVNMASRPSTTSDAQGRAIPTGKGLEQ